MITIGMWNVFWQALDDPLGQQAVSDALNNGGAFDAFAILEAAGSIAHHPAWVKASASRFVRIMGADAYVSGRSGHEQIAIWYRSTAWTLRWHALGEFEPGRPHLLVLLERKSDEAQVWMMAVHLPHAGYPGEPHPPVGHRISQAISAGLAANPSATADNLIILGDFNEFGECDASGRCSSESFRDARSAFAPMYSDWPRLVDVTPFNLTTCCTKWHWEGAPDWRHHFDHIWTSLKADRPPELMPYSYPGRQADGLDRPACANAACTGDWPPGGRGNGKMLLAHGTWHRGLKVQLRLQSPQAAQY